MRLTSSTNKRTLVLIAIFLAIALYAFLEHVFGPPKFIFIKKATRYWFGHNCRYSNREVYKIKKVLSEIQPGTPEKEVYSKIGLGRPFAGDFTWNCGGACLGCRDNLSFSLNSEYGISLSFDYKDESGMGNGKFVEGDIFSYKEMRDSSYHLRKMKDAMGYN